MRRHLLIASLAAFVAAGISFGSEPDKIEINSTWDGLGAVPPGRIVIERKNGKFRAEGVSIKADAVSELLAALDAPR